MEINENLLCNGFTDAYYCTAEGAIAYYCMAEHTIVRFPLFAQYKMEISFQYHAVQMNQ